MRARRRLVAAARRRLLAVARELRQGPPGDLPFARFRLRSAALLLKLAEGA